MKLYYTLFKPKGLPPFTHGLLENLQTICSVVPLVQKPYSVFLFFIKLFICNNNGTYNEKIVEAFDTYK